MIIAAQAEYAGGVLKPMAPLPLSENQRVVVQVTTLDPIAAGVPEDLAGLFGIWRGLEDEVSGDLALARNATRAKLDRLMNHSS